MRRLLRAPRYYDDDFEAVRLATQPAQIGAAALLQRVCDLVAARSAAARGADASAPANATQAAQRCFRCGGSGHRERECTAAPRERPCFLCGACASAFATPPGLMRRPAILPACAHAALSDVR